MRIIRSHHLKSPVPLRQVAFSSKVPKGSIPSTDESFRTLFAGRPQWQVRGNRAYLFLRERNIVAKSTTMVGNVEISGALKLTLEGVDVSGNEAGKLQMELKFIEFFGGFGADGIEPILTEALMQWVGSLGLATFDNGLRRFEPKACAVSLRTLYDEKTSPPDVRGLSLVLSDFRNPEKVRRGFATILDWVDSLGAKTL